MFFYLLTLPTRPKGTELEPMIKQAMLAEANGTMMYYALAHLAKEQGLDEIAETIMKAEYNGMADKVRAAGFTAAADEMEIFAKQEGHHGEVIEEILKKYKPADSEKTSGKIYVCPICGYEYEGDITAEPEDWVCPLCGQPKSVFKLK